MNVIRDKKIVIVGAGPAGLTLARLLQMRGADVTVYERDNSRDSRDQGATLDLHHDSGLAALEAAGLMDAFRANFRPEVNRLRIVDDQARVLYDFARSEDLAAMQRPEIDRGPLRTLLVESLRPGTLHWDRKLESVTEQRTQVQLSFAGGESVLADLVIAADGVNSRVRSAVTPIRPVYSGVTIVEGKVSDAAAVMPEVVGLLGTGAIFATGGEKTLNMGTKGDGSAAFYCGRKTPESWSQKPDIDASNSSSRVAWFHQAYPGWSSFWDALFKHAHRIAIRPQYYCPFNQHWDAKPNMTMIGDAAHVMPPYAGEGVNMAMLDALMLSQQLLSDSHHDMQSAIAAYESEMFTRAAGMARITMQNTETFHSPDAASQLVAMFKEFAAQRGATPVTEHAASA